MHRGPTSRRETFAFHNYASVRADVEGATTNRSNKCNRKLLFCRQEIKGMKFEGPFERKLTEYLNIKNLSRYAEVDF